MFALAGRGRFVLHVQEVAKLIELDDAPFFEGHLPSHKFEAEFDAESFIEKATSLLELGFEIPRASIVTEPDLFYFLTLLSLILPFLALFFVLVLSVVENFSNRRLG